MSYYFDNFERADGGIGSLYTTVTGVSGGGFNVASKRAVPSTPFGDCWSGFTGLAFANDQYSKIAFDQVGVETATSVGSGPSVRINPATPGMGYYTTLTNTNGCRIAYRPNGGSGAVTLITNAQNWLPNDIAMLTAIGNLLSLYRNGTLVMSVTDNNLAGGSPGIFYSSTASPIPTVKYLEMGDIVVPASYNLNSDVYF